MRLTSRQIQDIRKLLRGRVLEGAPLSRFTSFRIGGPADLLVEPATPAESAAVRRYIGESGLHHIFLGAGTNVLFHDEGFRGIVVRMRSLRDLSVQPNGSGRARVTAGAGVPLPVIVAASAKLGWTGLEPLWGIPGSFGGAVVTNAGAGGVSIGDFLEEVTLITADGEEVRIAAAEVGSSYRNTALPPDALLVNGVLRLESGETAGIREALLRARFKRRASQPRRVLSAGCIFKNPASGKAAGALIDRLGFKGMRVGDAEVSTVHANFIVNRGTATAAHVMELIRRIRDRVSAETDIELALEIELVPEETERG